MRTFYGLCVLLTFVGIGSLCILKVDHHAELFAPTEHEKQLKQQLRIDYRIRQLRRNELRGGLFEELAKDLIRGRSIPLRQQARAAQQAEDELAPTQDAFTRSVYQEAVRDFVQTLRELEEEMKKQ